MDSEKIYSVEEVVSLLKTKRLELQPREKNLDFKFRAGCTLDDIYNCVRNLEVRHFYAGPLDDDDPSKKGKLYIFKTMFLYRYWVYIKVKIRINNDNKNEFVIVLSFHD